MGGVIFFGILTILLVGSAMTIHLGRDWSRFVEVSLWLGVVASFLAFHFFTVKAVVESTLKQ